MHWNRLGFDAHELEPGQGRHHLELPGISLLDAETARWMTEAELRSALAEVVVRPVADLLDRTVSIDDLGPFLLKRPRLVAPEVRERLAARGCPS